MCAQFWCHRPPTQLVCTVIPQVFRGRPDIDLASAVSRPGPSEFRKPVHKNSWFWGVFPGQTVNFYIQHVTHILKAIGLTVNLVNLILWPITFFVTLWEWTGSISRNIVVTRSLLNFGFLPLNRKYRGFPGLHGNRNNRNGGTKKGEVDISPEFIADVDWTHKLFSLQTSNHGNLEICWKRPLTAWSQVWWRIFLFVQLLGVFGTFWTF